MVFCVHCATENDHEGKFCRSCGRTLVRHVSKDRAHNATTTSSSPIGTDSASESSPQPVAAKRKESEPEEKPTIPSGERIVFPISKLPKITKQRIAHALAEESPNGIVPSQSSWSPRLHASHRVDFMLGVGLLKIVE